MSPSRATGWGAGHYCTGDGGFHGRRLWGCSSHGSPAGEPFASLSPACCLFPRGFTLMWMTVFGNSAIYLIMNQGATDLANTVQQDVSLALFNFLEHFPFSSVLSFIAMAMVIVFFVTSADSGAMVVDTLASGGVANTPVWQRIFWASLMGIVAIALLLAGGLSALQTVTIASALPFSVILLISIYGLLKALRRDLTKRESLSMATIAPTAARNPIPWQRRLRNIAYLPKRSLVKRFMDDVIQPAMTLVQEELNKQGTISHISDAVDDRIRLEVDLGNELNFIYEVRSSRVYLTDLRARRNG